VVSEALTPADVVQNVLIERFLQGLQLQGKSQGIDIASHLAQANNSVATGGSGGSGGGRRGDVGWIVDTALRRAIGKVGVVGAWRRSGDRGVGQ